MNEEKITFVRELLKRRKYAALKAVLTELNPADIALVFSELDSDELVLAFRITPKDIAADTFVEMEPEQQEQLIHNFTDKELKEVVDEMYVDDAVDIIEEMPANVVKRILRAADAVTRKNINMILQYPDDSAGSIMTTEYITLRRNMTVDDALRHIRRTGTDKETIYTCYVTESNKLIGVVSVKNLLLSEDSCTIEDVMESKPIFVVTTDDKEQVARRFDKYNFLALPVVDEEGRMVGIVTIDDAMDVLQEEAAEDMEMMAAIVPNDRPYMRTGVFETWKKRIPWLVLLMILATFTGMIMSAFESALKAQIILAAFIPMIMNTAGNSGSQASVTIIHGLSVGDIAYRDTLRVIRKEICVALLCGLTLAVAIMLKVIFLDRLGVSVALVIAITIIFAVVFAKLIGCVLPIGAKRIGFDPAVMASPFITTIVDALSLLVYFTVAGIFLDM